MRFICTNKRFKFTVLTRFACGPVPRHQTPLFSLFPSYITAIFVTIHTKHILFSLFPSYTTPILVTIHIKHIIQYIPILHYTYISHYSYQTYYSVYYTYISHYSYKTYLIQSITPILVTIHIKHILFSLNINMNPQNVYNAFYNHHLLGFTE